MILTVFKTGAVAILGSLLALGFIILICFLIIFTYKYFYKRNMNKALDGEAAQGLFDPGQFVKTIAVLGLITLSIVSLVKIKDLETQLINQNNRISQLIQDVWYLRNDIDDLEDQISDFAASQALIQGFNYTVTDIDSEGNIIYQVNFTLLELGINDDVTLIVNDGSSETEIDMLSTSLNFSTELILEDQQDYDLYVLIEGSHIQQERLGTIRVRNDFEGRFELDASGHQGGDDPFEFHIQVQNLYIGSEAVKLDSMVCEVYVNGTLLDTYTANQAIYETSEFELFGVDIEFEALESDDVTCMITLTDNLGNVYTYELTIL